MFVRGREGSRPLLQLPGRADPGPPESAGTARGTRGPTLGAGDPPGRKPLPRVVPNNAFLCRYLPTARRPQARTEQTEQTVGLGPRGLFGSCLLDGRFFRPSRGYKPPAKACSQLIEVLTCTAARAGHPKLYGSRPPLLAGCHRAPLTALGQLHQELLYIQQSSWPLPQGPPRIRAFQSLPHSALFPSALLVILAQIDIYLVAQCRWTGSC